MQMTDGQFRRMQRWHCRHCRVLGKLWRLGCTAPASSGGTAIFPNTGGSCDLGHGLCHGTRGRKGRRRRRLRVDRPCPLHDRRRRRIEYLGQTQARTHAHRSAQVGQGIVVGIRRARLLSDRWRRRGEATSFWEIHRTFAIVLSEYVVVRRGGFAADFRGFAVTISTSTSWPCLR